MIYHFSDQLFRLFKEILESFIHKSITIKSVVDFRSEGKQAFGWHGLGFYLFASATCAVKTDRLEIHAHPGMKIELMNKEEFLYLDHNKH